ncbi:MAG: crotonase/enoyl-CoA hydratase family protein [Acidimicrobiales bacterium]
MVDYEVRGRVAVLTINRPDKKNAVNGEVARGMEAAIDRLEDDPEVWLGVLQGAGSVFCAGADLKAINEGRAGELQTERGGFAGIVARKRTKPIIAAVDGPALAGGTEIVLACDLVVASRAASFGIPEVKRSLVAAAGGLFRLPRLLPRNIALELGLTGDPISAERAAHFGFVNELCEPGEALETALALAERIAKNAPLAVRETRRLMLELVDADDETGFRESGAAMINLASTEDFWEGPKAFLEKREPEWKGR